MVASPLCLGLDLICRRGHDNVTSPSTGLQSCVRALSLSLSLLLSRAFSLSLSLVRDLSLRTRAHPHGSTHA